MEKIWRCIEIFWIIVSCFPIYWLMSCYRYTVQFSVPLLIQVGSQTVWCRKSNDWCRILFDPFPCQICNLETKKNPLLQGLNDPKQANKQGWLIFHNRGHNCDQSGTWKMLGYRWRILQERVIYFTLVLENIALSNLHRNGTVRPKTND
jgi:hypothetical protein